MVKEEAKAQALSAATNEFEKLFKKQDFGRMKVAQVLFLIVFIDLYPCIMVFVFVCVGDWAVQSWIYHWQVG